MQRIHVFDHVGWCLEDKLLVVVTVVAACRVAVRVMSRGAV
jgi:hypothetical protein